MTRKMSTAKTKYKMDAHLNFIVGRVHFLKQRKLCLCQCQLILTSMSAALSSSTLWDASCLIGVGDTMGLGTEETDEAMEPVPVDHGDDDHTEFTNEPHTETGEASSSSDTFGAL